MGEEEALDFEFDELSEEDVADTDVNLSSDENIIELIDVVEPEEIAEETKPPSTSVSDKGKTSDPVTDESADVLVNDQDLDLDTDLEAALEGLELSEEDEEPVPVESEPGLEGLEQAALEFEEIAEAGEFDETGDAEVPEPVKTELESEFELDGLEQAAVELEEIAELEESEDMEKVEEEELSLDSGLELPDVDLSEVMPLSDEEPEGKEIMDAPTGEGLAGISDERLETIITSVVEEVVERVARETMARVAEKVITEAIDALKKSLEIPAD